MYQNAYVSSLSNPTHTHTQKLRAMNKSVLILISKNLCNVSSGSCVSCFHLSAITLSMRARRAHLAISMLTRYVSLALCTHTHTYKNHHIPDSRCTRVCLCERLCLSTYIVSTF